MGWYLIFVTCFFSFPIARTTILVGPKSAVYPEGSNVTLQCLAERTNRIVWEDVNDNTVIFIDKEKSTRKEKFDNFVITNGEDNFSLTIVNAQLSDEGFYACEEGDESRSANVTIEAGADLSILVNNTILVPENRTTITEDEQVFVMCKAEGAKPAVRLKLKFGENEWIESNNTITNEGLHFTTETRVVHRVTRADTTITCQATGQVSIPPSTTMISMNVLHKPTCVIELGTDLAKCQCVSNPAVTTYSWYINGELQSTDPSLRIHEYIPANITCLASNEVGTSPLTSPHVSLTDLQNKPSSDAPSKYVVIITVFVCVCAIVIAVILIIVCKRSKDAKDTVSQTAGESTPLNAQSEDKHDDAQDLSGDDERNTHLVPEQKNEEVKIGAGDLPGDDGGKTHPIASTSGKGPDETGDSSVVTNDKNFSSVPAQKDDPRLQQLISTISTAISQDWEIFAIEDLFLETETVKEIIRANSEVSDQLQAALKHWVTFCPDASKSYLEEKILPNSEVYDYCRDHPREGENSKSKTETAESGEQFLQDPTFPNLLKEVVKYVGHIGAQRLVREYREQNVDTFTDSQFATLTGQSFLNLLQQENRLTDDMESLSRLKKALDDSLLFRASHLVGTYINKNDPRLQVLISTISTVISYDWEIFAIEDLSLETETVKEIIRANSEVSDQLRAALEHWVTFCPEASNSYLEKKILTRSEVYDYCREHPRTQENSKSSEQFLQDATFSNLLKEVVKYVGHIGAQRLLHKYREQNVDTSTDSQIATLTEQSFLNLLQKENLWTDDMESLSRLKKALDDSLLLRASHLVDTYINKKEKLEKNLSFPEAVP